MQRALDRTILCLAPITVALIIVLIPFHAFLTISLAHIIGHYTLLRLWKEILLLGLGLAMAYLLFTRPAIRARVVGSRLWWLVVGYAAVQVVWGLVALATHQVTRKALGYGWVVDTRPLVFLVIAWIVALAVPRLSSVWRWLVIPSALVVVGFGLLQHYVLPFDVLKYVGYGPTTIDPYETVNANLHYLRLMSTLRGANPLGAYLVVAVTLPAAALAAWWRAHALRVARLWTASAVALVFFGTVALVFTYSRSAWVGLVISLAVVGWVSISQHARKVAILTAVAVLVVSAIAGFSLSRNATFQNVFWHTETHSSIPTTSNDNHLAALKQGLTDGFHEPLGRGPGTAGPASVYNTGHAVRIAENYYLQQLQETGWIGLALFVVINVVVGYELWIRRRDALALGLVASLVGLTLVNLLSHAWADDTLAYVWWGLAGIALALPVAAQPTSVDGRHRSA